MMQCASCDTRMTDHAAETGICPKCGMPLPGIGGTMRFSESLFATLPDITQQSLPSRLADSPADSPADSRAITAATAITAPTEITAVTAIDAETAAAPVADTATSV